MVAQNAPAAPICLVWPIEKRGRPSRHGERPIGTVPKNATDEVNVVPPGDGVASTSVKVETLALVDATWRRFTAMWFQNILAVSEYSGGFRIFWWFQDVMVVSECATS